MTEENKLPAFDRLIENVVSTAYAHLANQPFYVVAELLLDARERRQNRT